MTGITGFLENPIDFFLEYGVWGLITLSFLESSFFPIPPDVILIPLSIVNPGMAVWYALFTTLASVVGGILGYFIGCKAGRPVLKRFISPEKLGKVDSMLYKYGGWAVAIAGFTPIPYKVFTIASGISRVKMSTFLIASFVGRGTRFLLEGIIIVALGEKASQFLDKYLQTGTIATSLVLVAGVLAFKYRKRLKFAKLKELSPQCKRNSNII